MLSPSLGNWDNPEAEEVRQHLDRNGRKEGFGGNEKGKKPSGLVGIGGGGGKK